MINSILNRHKDTVHFHNIKTNTDIITDPQEIKCHITNHFKEWTAHHPYSETIFDQHWKTEYEPKQNINTNWYNSILYDITIDEVMQTV